MKVFINWSGQRARIVAEALRSWLGVALHKVEPWISSEDLEPGALWNSELASKFGGQI